MNVFEVARGSVVADMVKLATMPCAIAIQEHVTFAYQVATIPCAGRASKVDVALSYALERYAVCDGRGMSEPMRYLAIVKDRHADGRWRGLRHYRRLILAPEP